MIPLQVQQTMSVYLATFAMIMVYGIRMALAMHSRNLLAMDLFPVNRGMTSSLRGSVHSAGSAVTADVIPPCYTGMG